MLLEKSCINNSKYMGFSVWRMHFPLSLLSFVAGRQGKNWLTQSPNSPNPAVEKGS